ncbi:MAG: hypothetical protein K7J46_15970 [Bryobacter sp.]|nr:hypothetical protein [Bryobacter sp. CoA8 C33]
MPRRRFHHLAAHTVNLADSIAPLKLGLPGQGKFTILPLLNRINISMAANDPFNTAIPALARQRVKLRRCSALKKPLWQLIGFSVGLDWQEGVLTFDPPLIGLHARVVLG